MTLPTTHSCLNCGTPLTDRYCTHCGQAAATGRLRLGEILKGVLVLLSTLDSKIARTAVGLTRNPGKVCKAYVEGQRIRYVAPLRYCVTIVALMVLVNVLTGFDPGDFSPTGTTERQREVQRIAAAFVVTHLDLVLFLVLPALVVIYRVLFFRSGRNLAEVSVFVLYTMGQIFLLGLLFTPLRFVAFAWQLPLRLALQIAFLSWSATVFFDTSPIVATLKSVVASLCYFALLGITVLLLLLPKIMPIFRGTTP